MSFWLHVKGRVVIDFDECIDMDEYGQFDGNGIMIPEAPVLKTAVCAYITQHIGQLDMELKGLKVKAE